MGGQADTQTGAQPRQQKTTPEVANFIRVSGKRNLHDTHYQVPGGILELYEYSIHVGNESHGGEQFREKAGRFVMSRAARHACNEYHRRARKPWRVLLVLKFQCFLQTTKRRRHHAPKITKKSPDAAEALFYKHAVRNY